VNRRRQSKNTKRGAPPPLLAEAVKLHQAGRLAEAEERYAQVLRDDPNQADALHLLGVIAHQRGDAARAVELIGKAVRRNPGAVTYLNNLGAALIAQDRFADAEKHLRKAVKLRPDYVDAITNLGNAQLKRGDMVRAEASYRKALGLDPARADAHNNLGSLLADAASTADAIAHYRQALAANPYYVDAHVNLGNALLEQDDAAAAEQQYRQALDVQVGHPPSMIGLATALIVQDRSGEAEDCLRALIRAHPDDPRGYKELGDLLQDVGAAAEAEANLRQALDLDLANLDIAAALAASLEKASRLADAAEMAQRVLEQDPANVAASITLAKCERRGGRSEQGLARLTALDQGALPADAAAAVSYESGALHDRLGQYEDAYAAYAAANELNNRHWRARAADRDMYPDEIARLQAAFTPDWVGSWSAPVAETDPAPVFLIGFPRSGTTLLDQILNAHPRIRTLEELPAVDLVKEALKRRGDYPEALADLDAETVAELRRVYAEAIADELGEEAEGKLIVDKMPLNTTDVGLIHRVFPSARFLLSIRHPCDVCLSGFMQAFRPNPAMVHFDTLDHTAKFYAQVMTLWRHYRSVLPLQVHMLRYEVLVADMSGEVGRLLEFLGLPWEDAVLEYAEKAKTRRIRTPSYHQVVQPIYNRSVARWLNYRSHYDRALPLLAPFIEAFGYPPPDEV